MKDDREIVVFSAFALAKHKQSCGHRLRALLMNAQAVG